MVFSSIEFIFIFLPLFIISYFLVRDTSRNAWLFAGSILFYTIGSIKHTEHIVLFLLSILMNFLFGRLLGRNNNRMWLFIGVGANLVCLIFFKFFHHVLPIGISFYTFQAIAYLCDIYNKKCDAEKSFEDFGVYMSMFPQLIAGPIVKYTLVGEQIHNRKHTLSSFAKGLQIFVLGLGSKVLLANNVGLLWAQLSAIGYESISTPLAWLGIFAYSFQIYFDFWGYSLMAMGLGRLVGFEIPKNFDYPYLSTSITEFWRRWHMTLGSWFKEYVYFLLGGNRRGKIRTACNLFAVWLLTGLWHGANWNFVLWGMVMFALILVEKAGLKYWLDRYSAFGHVYITMVIPLSWVVFAHTDLEQMILLFGRLFGAENTSGYVFKGDYIKYGREYLGCLLLCVLFATKIPGKIWRKLKHTYVGQVVIVGVFVGVVYCLRLGLDNPFLYYQF